MKPVRVHRYSRRRDGQKRKRLESPVFREEGEVSPRPTDLPGIDRTKKFVMLGIEKPRTRALFKSGQAAHRESIVSTIDDLLGWNLVPKTTVRDFGGEIGSIQEWMPRSREPGVDMLSEPQFRRDVFRIAALDFIIGNTDRHRGNILVKGNRLYAIDHGNVLTYRYSFYPVNAIAINIVADKPLPEDILKDLRNLEEGDLRAALAPIMLEEKDAAEGAVWRWKYLKKAGKIVDPWSNEFQDAAWLREERM